MFQSTPLFLSSVFYYNAILIGHTRVEKILIYNNLTKTRDCWLF